MGKYLESAILAALAAFAPIKTTIITVIVLTLADMITGVLAARKRGEPITSAGFKSTVGKLVLYEIALCVSFLVQQYLTGDLFPASKLVAALIGLVELSSVLENLNTLNGKPIFASILTKITQAQEKK